MSIASEDFAEQVAPLRPGLLLHCYRMLGSSHDAEDAVQETLLRGWRGVDRFEGRSSLRTWLYTVATNVCLREIERRGRRLVPVDLGPAADPADGLAAPLTETVWLGPLPDAGITWESSPADAVYEQREAVELGVHRRAAAPPGAAAGGAGAARRARVLGRGDRGDPGHDRPVGDQRAGPGPRHGPDRAPRAQPAGGAPRGGRPPGARHGRGVHRGLGAERRRRGRRAAGRGRRDVHAAVRRVVPRPGRGRRVPHRDAAAPGSAVAAGGDHGQRPAGAGLHASGTSRSARSSPTACRCSPSGPAASPGSPRSSTRRWCADGSA